MQAQRFSRDRRIRRRPEFDHVFSNGSRYHGRYVTLVIADSRSGVSRLGLVASRKVGNAVARNLAKRLIREAFRKQGLRADTTPVDVVAIPRREFFDADFASLETDFRTTLRRSSARAKRHAR